MARKDKVLESNGIDKRELGYYSTPKEVSDYLYERITSLQQDPIVLLDPCVGKEELSLNFSKNGIPVTGYDIYQHQEHYSCDFVKKDFIEHVLDLNQNTLFSGAMLQCNTVIMNPPYNCHEVDYLKKNKKRITRVFPETKALNMYSIFIDAVITYSPQETIIGMIVSDSFLTAKMHAALRKKILDQCKIIDLLLCPTNLFWDQGADVRTCILILKKSNKAEDTVRILQRPKTKEDLTRSLINGNFESVTREDIVLTTDKDYSEIVIGTPKEIMELFEQPRIGDLFPCKTGISTGNDKKYLSKSQTPKHSIPFYKNPASSRYFYEAKDFLTSDYLKVDKEVSNFMVRNKGYIGKEGISCSSMGVKFGACYMPSNCAFGVNANIFPAPKDIWWLLSYLNSRLVTFLLRGVLIRSNMVTSGYVSRIPVIQFNQKQKFELTKLAKKQWELKGNLNSDYTDRLNQIVYEAAELSDQTLNLVENFDSELYRNV